MKAEDAIIYKLLDNIDVDTNGCFNWRKHCGNHGYGVTCYKNKLWTTHRLSFELFRRSIPTGMFVCHKCDNRRCLNPSHLFLGSAKDNSQDAIKKGRATKPPRSTQKLNPGQVREIAERYSNGAGSKSLAVEFGVTQRNILDICAGKTWQEVKRTKTERRPVQSKLTDDQVREIRARRLAGEQGTKIAMEFCITPSYVSAICKGRTLNRIQ